MWEGEAMPRGEGDPFRVAVLDDYQGVAHGCADWRRLEPRCSVDFFRDPIPSVDLVSALRDYDAVVAMRERTRLEGRTLAALPRLSLIVTTGMRNAAIDVAAARDRGVTVCGTDALVAPTVELTWGLVLALARHIPAEVGELRDGRWQSTVGVDLSGSTIGIVGLGSIGRRMARVARSFDMHVLAWSQNLDADTAEAAGAQRVPKDELLATADIVTLHLRLSARTHHIVGERELGTMKRSSLLVNTARAGLVDEAALVRALADGRIAGAAIDVFESEPLPSDSLIRSAPSAVLTPHLGYVTRKNYELMYSGAVDALVGFLAGAPPRVVMAESDTAGGKS